MAFHLGLNPLWTLDVIGVKRTFGGPLGTLYVFQPDRRIMTALTNQVFKRSGGFVGRLGGSNIRSMVRLIQNRFRYISYFLSDNPNLAYFYANLFESR